MSSTAFPPDEDSDSDVALDSDVTEKTQEPRKYACVLHNDDYSTMEFVIEVLTEIFRKTHDEAVEIMLHVHHRGQGVAGVYSYEIAETKSAQVQDRAQAQGYPLKCSVEPA